MDRAFQRIRSLMLRGTFYSVPPIQNGWLYLYYSDGYTFIIEYPSVSGRYFYGTAEDGFEIRLEWVDGRSIRKKVS